MKTHLTKVLPGVFLMFVALAIIMTGGMFVYLPSTAFGMSDEEAIDYLKTNPGGLITVNKMGATTNLIQTMSEETSAALSYSIGSNDYATLKEAIDSVADGGSATIVVTQDVVDSSEAIVPSNKTITIDTNGNTITKTVYTIVNDGNLSIIGGGRIIAGGSYTVTLNANNGMGGTASVIAISETEMPSATMPTRTDYRFDGYYDASSGGTQYYTAAGASARNWDKTAATTLYAHWTAYVAKIGSTYYLSVQAAINAATSGQTITVLTNSTEKLTMTNKNLTLNLNGKTLNTAISISGVYITINGSGTINNASYTSDHTISVNNGGILTINNVTVYNYATVDKCGIAAYNSSTALIYGCNVTATKYWALSCQNGSRMDYSTSSGHVTAKGGSVYGYALFLYGGGATFNTNSSATLQGGYKNDGDANYYVW